MITGQDLPDDPPKVRGPRTLVLRNLLWLPLAMFLWA